MIKCTRDVPIFKIVKKKKEIEEFLKRSMPVKGCIPGCRNTSCKDTFLEVQRKLKEKMDPITAQAEEEERLRWEKEKETLNPMTALRIEESREKRRIINKALSGSRINAIRCNTGK